jgi:hypothetical protein
LDYIKVKAEPADQKADPVLSWSANIITMNRRRAIIVANDSSQYGFVLSGIKSKDIKELEGLLLNGVRTCLEAECIAPELIQQCMNDCGSKVTCTKTANPSAVARLNKLCLLASGTTSSSMNSLPKTFLSGEGDAPPEDAGGYPGYARLHQVLADPEDPEDPDYNNIKTWYQGMHCMPFDLDRVNRKVEKSLRAYGSW